MTMSDPVASDALPKPPPPSMAATVVAALPPLVFPVVGLALLAVAASREGGLMRMIEEAGWSAWLVLLALFFGATANAVLAALHGRGLRVPAVAPLMLAALPWLCGLAGLRLGMRTASRAVAGADPAMRATMIAQGLSEAINARILGAWSTACLASALGVSLAVAAAGQRAPNRRWAFAAVGALLALPLLGAVGYGVVTHLLGRDVLFPLVCALGALVALPLAAGAPGADAPHARAAALAAAAVPALLLSWVASAAAVGSDLTRQVFGAIASVEVGDRVRILAQGLEETGIASVVGWVGGGALFVATLAVAGWAATRARPSVGRLVGGASVAAVVLVALGMDVVARSGADHDVESVSRAPWDAAAGFRPVVLEASRSDVVAAGEVLLLGTDGVAVGGLRVTAAELATEPGAARAAALVRTQVQAADGAGPEGPGAGLEHFRRYLIDEGEDGAHAEPTAGPAVALAVDSRVTAPTLRAFARAAAAGGAHSLLLLGTGGGEDEAARATLARESPVMAALVSRPESTLVLLESALPAGYADQDRLLWHATLGAATRGSFAPRAGSEHAPLPYDAEPRRPSEDDNGMRDRGVVYLALGDDASAASLASAVSAAAHEGRRPLLVVGALPGSPDQALGQGYGFNGGGTGDPNAEGTIGIGGDLGPIGLGALGTLGGHGTEAAGDAPMVHTGDAEVRGSLAPEVIRRVVRRHLNEVRFCYEQGLAQNPMLAGRVTVQFVIAPGGDVQTAAVQSSTIGAPAVESCITTAVRRWQFPSPEGGGVVVVAYPFTFTYDPSAARPGIGGGNTYGGGGLGLHGGGAGYGS